MTKLEIISIIAKINNLQQQAVVQPANLVQQAGQMAIKLGKDEIIKATDQATYDLLSKTQTELKSRIAVINVTAAANIPDFPV